MRNMTISSVTLALVLAACSTPQHVAIKPIQRGGGVIGQGQDAYTEAKKQLEAGHPALALEGFRQALRSNGSTTDALNGLAVAYDQLGRFDLSRRFYELALATDPTNEKVLHNIAVSLQMSGADQQQQAVVESVPASAPESPEVHAERVSPGEIVVPLEAPKPVALAQMNAPSGEQVAKINVEPYAEAARVVPGEIMVPLEAPKPAALAQASAKSERLLVLNAVGRRGQAGRMRQYLAGVGWVDARVGNARIKLQRSVVVYPRGSRAAAERLAASLPFAPRMVQGQRVTRIVLMLGRNASRFDNGLRTRV